MTGSGGAGTRVEVAVVGSVNTDLTMPVPRLPRPGETVLGDTAVRGPGGKGANQAVACARLGRRTALVGCVGDDTEGADLLSRLQTEGVDISAVARVAAPTGLAVVLLEDGESTIVVSPGANARLSRAAVRSAASGGLLRTARAVLVQLEVPLDAVEAAAEESGGLVVLNPAPARPLPRTLLSRVDVLVPNRYELATLAGAAPASGADALADQARAVGAPTTVVTLGGDGALVVTPDTVAHVPAAPAQLVDATAAGDTFCAALVDALVDGADLVAATRWAARVAAVVVGRPGALDSLPSRAEVAGLRAG